MYYNNKTKKKQKSYHVIICLETIKYSQLEGPFSKQVAAMFNKTSMENAKQFNCATFLKAEILFA